MKTKLLVILICSILLSCNKDQALLNDIKGTWQLEKATFSKSTNSKQDSILTNSGTSLRFDVCDDVESKNRKTPCFAYLSHKGQSYKFEYFVSNGNKVILHVPSDFDKGTSFGAVAPFWINGFAITEQTSKKLVMQCSNCSAGAFGVIPFEDRTFIFNK